MSDIELYRPPLPDGLTRVQEIIELERIGDRCQELAAERIAAELADGKTHRQLAAEIGKSHTHVGMMARAWKLKVSNDDRPFNEVYNSPQVRGSGKKALAAADKPTVIQATAEPSGPSGPPETEKPQASEPPAPVSGPEKPQASEPLHEEPAGNPAPEPVAPAPAPDHAGCPECAAKDERIAELERWRRATYGEVAGKADEKARAKYQQQIAGQADSIARLQGRNRELQGRLAEAEAELKRLQYAPDPELEAAFDG